MAVFLIEFKTRLCLDEMLCLGSGIGSNLQWKKKIEKYELPNF